MVDLFGRIPVVGDKYVVIGDVIERDTGTGIIAINAGATPILAHEADCAYAEDVSRQGWNERFFAFANTSATSLNVLAGNYRSDSWGIPTYGEVKLSRVSVLAQHFNGSDPGDWTLRLQKNKVVSDLATFTIPWDASDGNWEVTSGTWSSEVTLDEGDAFTLEVDGPSVSTPRLRISVEVQVHPPTGASGLLPVVTKTAAYTATITDGVVLCDASSAAFTVTLPTAASSSAKRLYIKKIDTTSNAVTIDPNGSETVDSATSLVLSSTDTAEIISDGTEWWVL